MITLLKDVSTLATSDKFTIAYGREESNFIHSVQIVTNGTPTAVTVELLGSIDGDNFTCLGRHSMSGIELSESTAIFHIINKPVPIIKARVRQLENGANPQISVYYFKGAE